MVQFLECRRVRRVRVLVAPGVVVLPERVKGNDKTLPRVLVTQDHHRRLISAVVVAGFADVGIELDGAQERNIELLCGPLASSFGEDVNNFLRKVSINLRNAMGNELLTTSIPFTIIKILYAIDY